MRKIDASQLDIVFRISNFYLL